MSLTSATQKRRYIQALVAVFMAISTISCKESAENLDAAALETESAIDGPDVVTEAQTKELVDELSDEESFVVVNPELSARYDVQTGQLLSVQVFQRRVQLQDVNMSCLSGCRDGLVILSSGELRWRPTPLDVGSHTLELSASSARQTVRARLEISVAASQAATLDYLISPRTILGSLDFPGVTVAALDSGSAIADASTGTIALRLITSEGAETLLSEVSLSGGVAVFSDLDIETGNALVLKATWKERPEFETLSAPFDVLRPYDTPVSRVDAQAYREVRATLIDLNDPSLEILVQCSRNCGSGVTISGSGDLIWTPSADDVGERTVGYSVIVGGQIDGEYEVTIDVAPLEATRLIIESEFEDLRSDSPFETITIRASDSSGFTATQVEGTVRLFLSTEDNNEIPGGLAGTTLEAAVVNGEATFTGVSVVFEQAGTPSLKIGAELDNGLTGFSPTFSVQRYHYISSYEELRGLNTEFQSGNFDDVIFQLTQDIDASASMLSESAFEPIAIGSSQTFGASFKGNGHSIRNLVIDKPNDDRVGLFSTLAATGIVRDLHLENIFVRGDDIVGGVAGFAEGEVKSVAVHGQIYGNSGVGGIAGTVRQTGRIRSVVVAGSVVARSSLAERLGTVVGELFGSVRWAVSSATLKPAVSGTSDSGGVVGLANSGSLLNNTVFFGHFDHENLAPPAGVGIVAGTMQGSMESAYVYDSGVQGGIQLDDLPCAGTAASNPGLSCIRFTRLSTLLDQDSDMWLQFERDEAADSWLYVPGSWHPWPSSLKQAPYVIRTLDFDFANKIGSSEQSAFEVHGFCAPNGSVVSLVFSDSSNQSVTATSPCSFGKWTIEADLSALADGTIDLEAQLDSAPDGSVLSTDSFELIKDTRCQGLTTQASGFSGGTGTESDPYIICRRAEFEHLSSSLPGGGDRSGEYYEMRDSLNLASGISSIPVFRGHLDGAGFRVSGLTVAAGDHGLFESLTADCHEASCDSDTVWRTQASIRNLGIVDSQLEATDGPRGLLVSEITRGTVENVFVSGSIHSNTSSTLATDPTGLGLVVGRAQRQAQLTRIFAEGAVDIVQSNGNGFDQIGGIAGSSSASASLLSFSGLIGARQSENVGGVAGHTVVDGSYSEHSLEGLSSRVMITGLRRVGGILGYAIAPSISDLQTYGVVNARSFGSGLCVGSYEHLGDPLEEATFSTCIAQGSVIDLTEHLWFNSAAAQTSKAAGSVGLVNGENGSLSDSYVTRFSSLFQNAQLHLTPASISSYVADVSYMGDVFSDVHFKATKTAEESANILCHRGQSPSTNCTEHQDEQSFLNQTWLTLLGSATPAQGDTLGNWSLPETQRVPVLELNEHYAPYWLGGL